MKKRSGNGASGDTITTFLGNGARIEGLLDFEGTVRLDGRVEGRIEGRGGTLIIGEGAMIKAEVSVGKAIVMGEIHGAVHASERIELYPPGRIVGDIEAPVITIDAGAVLNGQCIMKPDAQHDRKKTLPPPPSSGSENDAAPSS